MPAIRLPVRSLVLVLATAATTSAQTWPGAGLAILTNGSSFREGECVRVALLALEDVPGPLVPEVSYEFQQSITLRSREGSEQTVRRPRLVSRPPGNPFDRLEAGSSVILDDTFCFGIGSAPGPYELKVQLSGGARAALATCVEFHPGEGDLAPATDRCDFALRALSRRDDPSLLTIEGLFPSHGLLRLAFLRGDRVLYLLEAGLVPTGPGELSFVLPPLGADAAGALDLLLQDQQLDRSTTLAGVSLPR
jgi:hypothetical protein